MCLVHCDTEWTRVVRDVSLEFYCCLPKILFPTDLPGDFLVADSAQWVSFSGCQSSVVGCGVWQWAVLFPVSRATPISLYSAHSSRDVWGQANSCCRLRFFHLLHAVTWRLKKGNKQRKYMYESICEISVHNVSDTLMPTGRAVHVNVNTLTLASVREKKREHVSWIFDSLLLKLGWSEEMSGSMLLSVTEFTLESLSCSNSLFFFAWTNLFSGGTRFLLGVSLLFGSVDIFVSENFSN